MIETLLFSGQGLHKDGAHLLSLAALPSLAFYGVTVFASSINWGEETFAALYRYGKERMGVTLSSSAFPEKSFLGACPRSQ